MKVRILSALVAIVSCISTLGQDDAKSQSVEKAASAFAIYVEVVDASGKPIKEFEVGSQVGNELQPTWQGIQSEQPAKIILNDPAATNIWILVRANGYAQMFCRWRNEASTSDEKLPEKLVFNMKNASSVGGTITDENGLPIQGASVRLSISGSGNERIRTGFFLANFRTDDQGKWTCDFAPNEISSATIVANHPDFVPVEVMTSIDQRKQELLDRTFSWKLNHGFDITGRVTDEIGRPVSGAVLGLGELNSSSMNGPFQRTDEEGYYRFTTVGPIRQSANTSRDDPIAYTITVAKAGYSPILASVPGFGRRPLERSTEKVRVADFTLKQGTKLSVRAIDDQNQPVANAKVYISNWHSTKTLQALQKFVAATETDENGYWEWPDAPEGDTISIDIDKRGYTRAREVEIKIKSDSVRAEIVLKRLN